MNLSSRLVLLLILLAVTYPTAATKPLLDTIVVGEESGEIVPEECCWVELPRSESLTAAKRSERCSAIGGPVGRFELIGDELWLVGLLKCGGELPLSYVYPEMPERIPAVWLSGKYFVNLSPRCFGIDGAEKSRKYLTLNIVSGVVSIESQRIDESECGSAL